MKITVHGGAHTLAPGEYEERDKDHDHKQRSVLPELRRGDPELIREQYAHLQKQHEAQALYVSGVLTWTEPLDRVEPHENGVMDDFKKMMCAGVDPCRFSDLWVRHLDKGRVEYHWSILSQDLISGKLVPLYFRRRDWALIELCQERINRRYGFTSPFELKRRRLFKVSYKSPSVRRRAEFDQARAGLESLFSSWPSSRDEVCARLEHAGWEIAERRQNFLKVSSEGGAYYLSGAFCHQAFTSRDYISKVVEGWTRKQQEIFSSAETIEHHYQGLFRWRADYLNNFLTAHKPRFGLDAFPISRTETIADAIADIAMDPAASPGLDIADTSLNFINNTIPFKNYEHTHAEPDHAGREVLDRAHRCIEIVRNQIQRVVEAAEGSGGKPGPVGAPNRSSRSKRQGRKGTGAGPNQLEAYWQRLHERHKQLQAVGTSDAPSRGFGAAARTDTPTVAAVDELQRKIVHCLNGFSAAISARERDAAAVALRAKLASKATVRGPNQTESKPTSGVIRRKHTDDDLEADYSDLPPDNEIS